MTKTQVKEFQLIDHGIDHSQYFQGCGVSFTRYEFVSTGCGNNFQEAMDDCMESIAQNHYGLDMPAFEQAIKDELGVTTASWPEGDSVPEDSEECYYYVSVRYNL